LEGQLARHGAAPHAAWANSEPVTHVLVLYTFDPHLGELSSSRRSPVDSGGTGSSGNKALAGFCIVGALGGGCRGAIGPARSPRARRLGSKSENSPKISCPIREPSDRPSVEQESTLFSEKWMAELVVHYRVSGTDGRRRISRPSAARFGSIEGPHLRQIHSPKCRRRWFGPRGCF
jgi:hypothetical protein